MTTAAAAACLATAPAADAATFWSGWKCNDYPGGVVTCMGVDWSVQADGTGVTLQGIQVKTDAASCANLEPNDGKYSEVSALWVDPSNQNTNATYSWGTEDCNWYKDLANAGSDTGPMDARLAMKARVNNFSDRRLYWGITVRTDGSSTLNYMRDEDA